jgi:hypothetical protein
VQVLLGGATSFMCWGEQHYPANWCNATMVILQVKATHQQLLCMIMRHAPVLQWL